MSEIFEETATVAGLFKNRWEPVSFPPIRAWEPPAAQVARIDHPRAISHNRLKGIPPT